MARIDLDPVPLLDEIVSGINSWTAPELCMYIGIGTTLFGCHAHSPHTKQSSIRRPIRPCSPGPNT